MPEAGETKEPRVTLNVSGLTQAIILASILAAGSYVWTSLQRVPSPDTIADMKETLSKRADDIQALREAKADTNAELRAINSRMDGMQKQLDSIERLLRYRKEGQ